MRDNLSEFEDKLAELGDNLAQLRDNFAELWDNLSELGDNLATELGKTSIGKTRFLSGIARIMGGGVYPCPDFLALFFTK